MLTMQMWEDVKVKNGDKLVAFLDPFTAHFLGIDAKKAAEILAVPFAEAVEGQPHLEVDRRQWNDALPRLNLAGFAVCHTEVPAGV